jgi:tetratricopeptide (TPR) repeat protein
MDRRLQEALDRFRTGDAAGAERVCSEILRQSPGHPGALQLLGLALVALDRSGEAVGIFGQARDADPENPATHLNLGNALANQGRREEALASYRKSLELDPGLAAAHVSIGRQLKLMGRLADAETAFLTALAITPDHVDVLSDLGSIKAEQGLYAESQAWFEKALVLEPDNPAARNGLGNALSARHSWDLAAAQYSRALASDSGLAEAGYNLGLVQLFRHAFEPGWQGYEHRLQCREVRVGLRKGAQTLEMYERLPRWRGPAEEPRHEVAIWAEQGIGDQILFSTLIPELIAAEVPFIYEVDRRLLAAYERAFPGTRFVALSKPPLGPLLLTSRVLLAGSLPGLFRHSRESFHRQPRRLFGALPQRVAHYRGLFAARGSGPKVALSWRSKNAVVRLGPGKNVPLMEFSPLLVVPGACFVDVQYGDTADERRAVEAATGVKLLHFDEVDYYNDLEELLAILEACDLVITTSNATAHLAGALGKRAWLLFLADRAPFYYWAHGGTGRSLWYPAVEIVTSPELVEWKTLIERAAQQLSREFS